MRVPGHRVAIEPNGPRISLGASGLGSKVSSWLGPPTIVSRITAPSVGRPPARAIDPASPGPRMLRAPALRKSRRLDPGVELAPEVAIPGMLIKTPFDRS